MIASVITTVIVSVALRAADDAHLLPWYGRPAPPAQGTEVPTLLGTRPEQARELLKARDLLFTISAERESAHYAAGTIAEQVPLPGSQIQRGSMVQAVVSRGDKPAAVPSVVGLKVEEAVKQVAVSGLIPASQKFVPSDSAPAGTVIATEPPVGTPIGARGNVALTISAGPGDKPLPKVTGLRLRAARALIEQQGFKVGKIRYGDDGDRAGGVVLEQRPPAATPAARGTAVDLVVNED